jgi:hypothetical protein
MKKHTLILTLLALSFASNATETEKRRRSCDGPSCHSRGSGRDRDVRTPRRDRRDRDVTTPRRDRRDRDVTTPRRDRRDRRVITRHRPHRDHVRHTRRYTRRDYYRTIPRTYVYRDRWILFSIGLTNGYYYLDNYPYYVFGGYRYRYSNYDICDYELVDRETGYVERTYYDYTCAVGYDLCADLRDIYNEYEYYDRYFCAERFQDYY